MLLPTDFSIRAVTIWITSGFGADRRTRHDVRRRYNCARQGPRLAPARLASGRCLSRSGGVKAGRTGLIDQLFVRSPTASC